MKKLIYFSASWCGPCRQLGPIMEEVALEANVQKVDVDKSPELTSFYGVRNIPTVIFVDDMGNEVIRKVGVNPKQTYLDIYNQN